MAECVCDAVAEFWSEFLHGRCWVGHGETLFPPELAAHGGERIGEGWAALAIPSAGRDSLACLRRELCCEQGDQGEQPQQAGRRAGDGLVRPLALRFHPEVVAHLAEGDLELPALDKPAQDLHGILGGVGAQQSLRIKAAKRIAHQHPADARKPFGFAAGTTGIPLWRQTAVAVLISTMRSPPPYQPVTVTHSHGVAGSASTADRVAKRLPLVGGRPVVPGRRGGAGS